MKKYKKEIGGKVEVKTLKDIVINKDGRMVFNPTEDMILADGWTEHVVQKMELPPEVRINQLKERKIRSLYIYDESEEVNDCIISYQGQEIHYWKSPSERNDLKAAARDFMSEGRYTYRLDLRDKGVSITLPCELLLQMMAALEVYAVDCFNVTTDHEFAINACVTMEEVESYDFRRGYPEKLTFNI